MKKYFMVLWVAFMTGTLLKAQDCLRFFPSIEGATLINRTYDANGIFLNTIIYRIEKSYGYYNGSDMQISYVLADNHNHILDHGLIDASCTGDNFYVKMVNRTLSTEVIDSMGTHTELTGNFMDYPDTFNSYSTFDGSLQTEGGEYTICSKQNKDEYTKVRIYNRKYEKNEKITTPAGTFDASKITFDFDCTKDKVTKTHKGIEWYAPGAGIVRSETYDRDDKLVNYTVLFTKEGK